MGVSGQRHASAARGKDPRYPLCCHLGGVVVSVLATGPKGRGFETGQGDGLLRAIKIRSTPPSRMGSKAGRSHVVRFYCM
jgi:hypothetical protein